MLPGVLRADVFITYCRPASRMRGNKQFHWNSSRLLCLLYREWTARNRYAVNAELRMEIFIVRRATHRAAMLIKFISSFSLYWSTRHEGKSHSFGSTVINILPNPSIWLETLDIDNDSFVLAFRTFLRKLKVYAREGICMDVSYNRLYYTVIWFDDEYATVRSGFVLMGTFKIQFLKFQGSLLQTLNSDLRRCSR